MGAGEVLFFSCANVHLLYVGEMKRERERETAKERHTVGNCLCYYRMCSLAIECVLLLVFSY